jgi:hypothetical protein
VRYAVRAASNVYMNVPSKRKNVVFVVNQSKLIPKYILDLRMESLLDAVKREVDTRMWLMTAALAATGALRAKTNLDYTSAAILQSIDRGDLDSASFAFDVLNVPVFKQDVANTPLSQRGRDEQIKLTTDMIASLNTINDQVASAIGGMILAGLQTGQKTEYLVIALRKLYLIDI